MKEVLTPLLSDLYLHNGTRVEYSVLSITEKEAVKREKAIIAKSLFTKLKNVTTPQVIDNGQAIEISYTSRGLDHFANDALLNHSGKYFSRHSMMRINESLEKAVYLPTSHKLKHPRTDGRNLWFTYADSERPGVYYKVTFNSMIGKYEFFAVVDRL